MSLTPLSAAVITSCALLASAAQAQSQIVHSDTARVSAADLDLRREPDARRLLERIGQAADSACRMGDPVWPDRGRDFERCRAEAIAEAVRRADAPLVSALHRRDIDRDGPADR